MQQGLNKLAPGMTGELAPATAAAVAKRIESGELSPFACRNASAIRRSSAERDRDTAIRPAFVRDAEKIVHLPAYNRMSGKTQVFSFRANDDLSRRGLHVQLVARVARDIGRALGLNLDLIEAIALGHDLGHTPFGHAGERALNSVCPGGFRHYEQSLRVVDELERDGAGLNLTWEVRDGIVHHTKGPLAATQEGQLVKLADHFAFAHHDFEDAVRAGVLSEDSVPPEVKAVLGEGATERLAKMVTSVIENSGEKIAMDPDVEDAARLLEDFMFEAVYTNPVAKSQEKKAENLVVSLYEFLLENPNAMPTEYQAIALKDGLDRAVCDYISGMSDRYAIKLYNDFFVPKGWSRE